jgi:hypothetical protein
MMLRKFLRLFTIKNRFEAWAVIYGLAVATVSRGYGMIEQYPGWMGYLMFAACTGAIFMAGPKILDATPRRRKGRERRRYERRLNAEIA